MPLGEELEKLWNYLLSLRWCFSAYGEGVFMAIQCSIIIFLVYVYGGRTLTGLVFLVAYTAIMWYLLSPLAPRHLIDAMQGMNIVIVMASKVQCSLGVLIGNLLRKPPQKKFG